MNWGLDMLPERVLENIMSKDRKHLEVVFKRVCNALQENPDIENLIFFVTMKSTEVLEQQI